MPGILPKSKSRTPGGSSCNYQACCITIICILVLALIALGLGFGIPAILKLKAPPEYMPGRAVEQLLLNTDLSKDPCQNFYEYACGNFSRNAFIEKGEEETDTTQQLEKEINLQILQLISAPKSPQEPSVFHKVKDFFSSCMNTAIIEERGTEPLTSLINDKLGGWPVVESSDWNNYRRDWLDLVSTLNRAKIVPNQLIDVHVTANYLDPQKSILQIKRPDSLGVPPNIFFGRHKDYSDLMVDVAIYFGAEKERAIEEMSEVYDFESDLYMLMINDAEEKQIMTVRNLQNIAPQVQWMNYLKTVLPYSIKLDDSILISQVKFVKRFAEFISEANIRTLTNYLIWRVVLINLQYLNKETIKFHDDFLMKVGGRIPLDRIDECIASTRYFVPSGTSLMYVQHFIDSDIKESVTKLVRTIQEEFENEIDRMNWFSNDTRIFALEKVRAVKALIAYPDDCTDKEAIEELYRTLNIEALLYFENTLGIKYWTKENVLWLLFKISNDSDWNINSDVTDVKPTYSLISNAIKLDLGILQGMYYDQNGPMTFNLGALGSVIGHEFFHSVDKRGSQHSVDGSQKHWWSSQSTLNFINSSDCFIKKYNDFRPPNSTSNVNGTITLAENLADYVGVTVAYRTYQNLIKKNGPAKPLPERFPWTDEQLFWMSYANLYCTRTLDKDYFPKDQNYSPNMFRLLGPLMGLPEFLKDFKCDHRSKMAKQDKRCTL